MWSNIEENNIKKGRKGKPIYVLKKIFFNGKNKENKKNLKMNEKSFFFNLFSKINKRK